MATDLGTTPAGNGSAGNAVPQDDALGEINKYDFRTVTKEVFKAERGLNLL